MVDIVYIFENKVYNSNVFIVKAYCVFDVTSYPLLTLTVILSILNKNLWFILIDYCCWIAFSVFCNKRNPNPAITRCKCKRKGKFGLKYVATTKRN